MFRLITGERIVARTCKKAVELFVYPIKLCLCLKVLSDWFNRKMNDQYLGREDRYFRGEKGRGG